MCVKSQAVILLGNRRLECLCVSVLCRHCMYDMSQPGCGILLTLLTFGNCIGMQEASGEWKEKAGRETISQACV